MTETDFLDKFPDGLIGIGAFSYLNSQDLYGLYWQYKASNKAHINTRKMIVRSLFGRTDAASISCQIRYLEAGDRALFRELLKKSKFKQILSEAMASPRSTLKHKSLILEAWNGLDIEKREASMPMELIRTFLNIVWYVISKLIITVNRYFFHLLEHEDEAQVLLEPENEVQILLKKFSDNPDKVETLSDLKAFLPKLNDADVRSFIPLILQRFDDVDKYVRAAALKTAAVLFLRLNETDAQSFVPSILQKLNDTFYNVRAAALETATVLFSKLNKADVRSFILLVLQRLDDANWYVHAAALETAAVFFPRFNETDIRSFIPLILKDLSDNNGYIRTSALKTAAVFFPRLNEADVQSLILIILKRLNDNCEVRTAALKTAAVFLPRLNEADVQSFIPLILQRLDDAEWYVREAALKTAIVLLPRLNEVDAQSFIPLILPRLDDTFGRVRAAALETAVVLLSRHNEIDIQLFTSHILRELHDNENATKTANIFSCLVFNHKISLTEAKSLIMPLVDNTPAIKGLKRLLNEWENTASISQESFREILKNYHPSKTWMDYFKSLWFLSSSLPAGEVDVIWKLNILSEQHSITKGRIERILSENYSNAARLRLFQMPMENRSAQMSGIDELALKLGYAFRASH